MGFQISFRQSGGVAGLIRGCDVDSDELPQEQAAELAELLRQARLDSAERSRPARPDALQFSYRITDESGQREVVLSGADLTPAIEALTQYLQRRSKPCRP